MPSLFDYRFIVNTGKGGVGKTTVSAAMASAFARRGRRVLLIELNTRDRFGSLFGVDPVGTEIVQIAPNIWAVDTTPATAMREYAMMILRVRALYGLVFENRVVERFLRVVPGLPELTMLGKAYYHETERDKAGRPVWDVVIIDAPATGHGMFLLQIPHVITAALTSGHMAEEAGRMLALLRDPRRTAINVVTLAEEMPINETLELRESLARELGVEVAFVIANGVLDRVFGEADLRLISELRSSHGKRDDITALFDAASFREERCAMQAENVDRLHRTANVRVLQVPYAFEPSIDLPVVERLGAHLGEAADRAARAT